MADSSAILALPRSPPNASRQRRVQVAGAAAAASAWSPGERGQHPRLQLAPRRPPPGPSRGRPPPPGAAPGGSAARRRPGWPSARTPRRRPRTPGGTGRRRTHSSSQDQPCAACSRGEFLVPRAAAAAAGWSTSRSTCARVEGSRTPSAAKARSTCAGESGFTGRPPSAAADPRGQAGQPRRAQSGRPACRRAGSVSNCDVHVRAPGSPWKPISAATRPAGRLRAAQQPRTARMRVGRDPALLIGVHRDQGVQRRIGPGKAGSAGSNRTAWPAVAGRPAALRQPPGRQAPPPRAAGPRPRPARPTPPDALPGRAAASRSAPRRDSAAPVPRHAAAPGTRRRRPPTPSARRRPAHAPPRLRQDHHAQRCAQGRCRPRRTRTSGNRVQGRRPQRCARIRLSASPATAHAPALAWRFRPVPRRSGISPPHGPGPVSAMALSRCPAAGPGRGACPIPAERPDRPRRRPTGPSLVRCDLRNGALNAAGDRRGRPPSTTTAGGLPGSPVRKRLA